MGRRDQDVHFLASKEEVQRIHEKMDELGIRRLLFRGKLVTKEPMV